MSYVYCHLASAFCACSMPSNRGCKHIQYIAKNRGAVRLFSVLAQSPFYEVCSAHILCLRYRCISAYSSARSLYAAYTHFRCYVVFSMHAAAPSAPIYECVVRKTLALMMKNPCAKASFSSLRLMVLYLCRLLHHLYRFSTRGSDRQPIASLPAHC